MLGSIINIRTGERAFVLDTDVHGDWLLETPLSNVKSYLYKKDQFEWQEYKKYKVVQKYIHAILKRMPEFTPRNPDRIDKTLEQIKKIWKENPDLRLCQLIGNCFEAKDLYYTEDNILLEALRVTYGEKKNKG